MSSTAARNMLTLENQGSIPEINGLPTNHGGCPCGKENHKLLSQFILCLFCGKLCHPECATVASVFVGSEVLDNTEDTLFWQSWKQFFPNMLLVPKPVSCICTTCYSLEDSQSLTCASDDEPFECVHRHINTTKRLSTKHSCVKCDKPVHGGCCIYLRDKGTHNNSCPQFWDRYPFCLPCFNDYTKPAILKSWMEKPENVEIDVKPSIILRQYFIRFAESMHEMIYGPKSILPTGFKTAEQVLTEEPQAFQRYMDLQWYGRDECYLTESDIDLVLGNPCIVSPNTMEVFLCLLTLYQPILNYLHKRESHCRVFISPTFFGKLFEAYHSNPADICGPKSGCRDRITHNELQPILFIPIMHPLVGDPSLVVVFDRQDVLIIEYFEAESELPLERIRREHHTSPVLQDFLKKVSTAKITVQTLYRSSPVDKLSRSCDAIQPNFRHVCFDMLELTKPCYKTVEDVKKYVQHANAEPDESDSLITNKIKDMIQHLRFYQADCFLQDLTANLAVITKANSPASKDLEEAQKLALTQITSLATRSDRHPSTIECVNRTTLTTFLTELVAVTGFILSDINSSADNVILCWPSEKSQIKLECCKCQDSLEQRMFLSFYRGEIPSPSAFKVWRNHFELTPGKLSKLCWQEIEAASSNAFSLSRSDGSTTLTHHNLKALLVNKLNAPKKLWTGPFHHLFRPLFWDANTVTLLVEILFHDHHKKDLADKKNDVLVCCSDRQSLTCYDNDEEKAMKGLTEAEKGLKFHPKPFASNTTTIICLAFQESHHAVFEIKRRSKLLVVYDGMDVAPTYSRKQIPKIFPDRETLADVYWSEYAKTLLQRFGLTGKGEQVAVGSDIQREEIRDGSTVCGVDELWQIQSVVFTYPDWQKRLIRQNDGYSCGRIAVLHVKKLLGFDFEINYRTGDKAARASKPQIDKLSIGSYLPNTDQDILSTVRNWIVETIPDEVDGATTKSTLDSHVRRSDILRDYDKNIEQNETSQEITKQSAKRPANAQDEGVLAKRPAIAHDDTVLAKRSTNAKDDEPEAKRSKVSETVEAVLSPPLLDLTGNTYLDPANSEEHLCPTVDTTATEPPPAAPVLQPEMDPKVNSIAVSTESKDFIDPANSEEHLRPTVDTTATEPPPAAPVLQPEMDPKVNSIAAPTESKDLIEFGYWLPRDSLTKLRENALRFQQFLEELPRDQLKEWMGILFGQTISVADLILMVAAATAQVEYFNDNIELALDNQQHATLALIKTICSATFPVLKLRKEGNLPVSTEKLPDVPEVSDATAGQEPTLHRPIIAAGLNGCSQPNLIWHYTECESTPIACSLLQGICLIPWFHTESQTCQFSPSCAPPINIRNVDVGRCFKAEVTHSNRGIIGSLASLNEKASDHSITHHKFSFWPYTMEESKNPTMSTCLSVGSRFSHAQLLSESTEYGHVIAREVTIGDIVALVDLLSIPTDKTGEDEKREAETKWPESYGVQVLYLLSQAFFRLSKNFQNLASLSSWKLFYQHLTHQARWCKPIEDFIPPPEDLVNFTSLLFQALNPVRGGFTDGQARMLSVAHFIRNVVPCGSDSDWCLDLLCKYKGSHTSASFGPKTSSLGNFVICATAKPIEIEQNLDNFLDDLRAVSMSRCQEADIIEKLFVSDMILIMMNSRQFLETPMPLKNSSIDQVMRDLFETIGEELYKSTATDTAKHPFDKMKEGLVGKVFRFPKMVTQQTGVSRSLFVLTHFLGSLLADPRSFHDLSDLINNEWRPMPSSRKKGIESHCDGPSRVCFGTSRSDELYIDFCKPLLPKLTPRDLSDDAWLQYLVTTFYAPAYLLARMYRDFLLPGARKPSQLTGASVLGSCFVGVCSELLHLISQEGLILPIPPRLQESLPTLEAMLVPEVEEDLEYGSTGWLKKQTPQKSNPYGWSNNPMMVYVVCYLLDQGIISFDRSTLPNINVNSDFLGFDKFRPVFKCKNFAVSFHYPELVKFLLVDSWQNDSLIDIFKEIQQALATLTKENFYYDLKKSFFSEGPLELGKEIPKEIRKQSDDDIASSEQRGKLRSRETKKSASKVTPAQETSKTSRTTKRFPPQKTPRNAPQKSPSTTRRVAVRNTAAKGRKRRNTQKRRKPRKSSATPSEDESSKEKESESSQGSPSDSDEKGPDEEVALDEEIDDNMLRDRHVEVLADDNDFPIVDNDMEAQRSRTMLRLKLKRARTSVTTPTEGVDPTGGNDHEEQDNQERQANDASQQDEQRPSGEPFETSEEEEEPGNGLLWESSEEEEEPGNGLEEHDDNDDDDDDDADNDEDDTDKEETADFAVNVVVPHIFSQMALSDKRLRDQNLQEILDDLSDNSADRPIRRDVGDDVSLLVEPHDQYSQIESEDNNDTSSKKSYDPSVKQVAKVLQGLHGENRTPQPLAEASKLVLQTLKTVHLDLPPPWIANFQLNLTALWESPSENLSLIDFAETITNDCIKFKLNEATLHYVVQHKLQGIELLSTVTGISEQCRIQITTNVSTIVNFREGIRLFGAKLLDPHAAESLENYLMRNIILDPDDDNPHSATTVTERHLPFWNREDISEPTDLLANLQNVVHELKCSCLFNMFVHHYFDALQADTIDTTTFTKMDGERMEELQFLLHTVAWQLTQPIDTALTYSFTTATGALDYIFQSLYSLRDMPQKPPTEDSNSPIADVVEPIYQTNRPRILEISLEPNWKQVIIDLFFDQTGRLRRDLEYAIDFSKGHNADEVCWNFATPRTHNIGNDSFTFYRRLQNALTESKLLIPNLEYIYDVSLTIGQNEYELMEENGAALTETANTHSTYGVIQVGNQPIRLKVSKDLLIDISDDIDARGLVTCRLDAPSAYTFKALGSSDESTSLTLQSDVGFQVTNNCCLTRSERYCPYRNSQERRLLREVQDIINVGLSVNGLDSRTTFQRICNIRQLQSISLIHFRLEPKK